MKVWWQGGIILAGAVCLGYLILRPSGQPRPSKPQTVEELRKAAIEGDEDERFRAVNELGNSKNFDDVFPLLLEAMNDSSSKVRGRAGAAVRRLLGDSFPSDFQFDADLPEIERAKQIKWLKETYDFESVKAAYEKKTNQTSGKK